MHLLQSQKGLIISARRPTVRKIIPQLWQKLHKPFLQYLTPDVAYQADQ